MWLTIDAMYRGQRVVYMDYLGYDEVAHHAGHDTEDAKGSLRSFDRHLATIEDASRRPPRLYELVVLSTTARAPAGPSSSATASPWATWCSS